jgi:hypothetical protein
VIGRPTYNRAALDLDQAAALRSLQAAFGVEQVTVTDIQPTSRPDQDPTPIQAPAAPTLLEEAS